VRRKSLGEVLGIRISKLLQILHLTVPKDPTLECASLSTIRIDDLNIRSLNSIGHISIKWTDILEDHLKLDVSKLTLTVVHNYLPLHASNGVWGWQDRYVKRIS
jgi:hypothetical protein